MMNWKKKTESNMASPKLIQTSAFLACVWTGVRRTVIISVAIIGVPAKLRTQDLPNLSQEHHWWNLPTHWYLLLININYV
jgi:hypothetical protein